MPHEASYLIAEIFRYQGKLQEARGVLDKAKKENKTKIITSSVEHPAVRSLCHNLQNNGFGIVELPVDIDNKKG